jgi:site-specific DNA-methyltransferase (adenine-specific)
MKSETFNTDCLEAMRQMDDNAFDLAIVDPPYGQAWGNLADITSGRTDALRDFFTQARKWDTKPSREYFNELKRVSVHQIVFGYNYFTEELGSTNDLIVWDKQITGNKNFLRFEMIYCSFNVSDIVSLTNSKLDKLHPCQKPVALYKWLLQNYAKTGDTILDTHLGSGSSRIAAYDLGFDFTGYELDTDYFNAQEQRFADHIAQPKLWEPLQTPMIQEALCY